ncbi:hypothetical protein [Faecalicatena orotica]|nr:hypothetical protein [Faecalicatena orotica]
MDLETAGKAPMPGRLVFHFAGASSWQEKTRSPEGIPNQMQRICMGCPF